MKLARSSMKIARFFFKIARRSFKKGKIQTYRKAPQKTLRGLFA